MAEFNLMVMGENGEPCEIRFLKEGENFYAICQCGLGRKGQLCEHQIYVLEGGSQRVMGEGRKDVVEIQKLFAKTKAEELFKAYLAGQAQVEKLKKDLAKKKKEVGQILAQQTKKK